MRNLLAFCLVFAACDNSELSGNKDLSMNLEDMSTSGDMSDGGTSCDVIAQDCPTGQRCTLVTPDPTMPQATSTACMPTGGSVMVGQTCVRNSGTIGDDNCAPGLFCTQRGTPATSAGPTSVCAKLCEHSSDCAAGEGCTRETSDRKTGVCIKKCTPFLGEGAGGCSGTMDCTAFTLDVDSMGVTAEVLDYFCRSVVGSGQYGDSCMTFEDCSAGLVCEFNQIDGVPECLNLCDDNHACAVTDLGLSCTPFIPARMGMSSNLSDGTCQ